MKTLYSLLVLVFLGTPLFGQNEGNSEHQALSVSSALIVDNIYNLNGGIKTGYASMGLFDFSVDYYPASRGMLKNTSFFAHILKTRGKEASGNYIGDIQVASNIEGRASRFIYECYINQKVKNFNLSLGLHDLNTEFMASEYAGDFINSSFGIFPVVSLNAPVSIFPVTSIGGILKYNRKAFDFAAGLYNLNHEFVTEESFDFNNHLFEKGFMGVVELRFRTNPENQLIGEYKIGGYYKDCHHLEDLGNGDDCFTERNHLMYFIADQLVWLAPNNFSLGIFTQFGIAPRETNYVPDYYGTGISLKSSGKKYFPDMIGLAAGTVGLSSFDSERGVYKTSRETAIELSFKKELFERISIQPDLQYIIKPSGTLNNAFVGILRLQVELNN